MVGGAVKDVRRWALSVSDLLHSTIGSIIGAALAAGLLALVGFISNELDSPVFWTVFLGALALVASVSAVMTARYNRRLVGELNAAGITAQRIPPWARSGQQDYTYLGIEVGRTHIAHGLVSVNGAYVNRQLPGAEARDLPGERQGVEIQGEVYDEILALIADADVDRLDGVGIGFPGQVSPETGRIVGAPRGLSQVESFLTRLASDYLIHDGAALRKLGLSQHGVTHGALRAQLRDRVRLDNDVNCAARAILNTTMDDESYTNFACVHIGHTGVGAGLVLEKRMYYGSDWAAGEIGHVSVDLPNPGDAIAMLPCECGLDKESASVHWQSMVNSAGLNHLAEELDAGHYRRLRKVSERLGQDVPQTLVQALKVADHRLATHSRDVHALSQDREFVHDYGRMVIHQHARYLALGLGALLNVLDLDHVVLTGKLIEELWKVNTYEEQVRRNVEDLAVIVTAQDVHEKIECNDDRSPTWQGAALMFCDSSHVARMFGAGAPALLRV